MKNNIFNKISKAIRDRTLLHRIWILIFIRLKFYKIFNLIAWITKVKPNKIVFSNYLGQGYGDNCKYIAEYIIENNLNFELVWLLDRNINKNNINMPSKIRIVNYHSFKALYELSTAAFWIDNTRKHFFPLKKKNQLYIQTWHGAMALKKIEKDAPSLPKSYINMAKRDSAVIDLILSGCKSKTEIYKSSFWYTGEVAEIGTPRNDIFFSKSKIIQAREKVNKFYSLNPNEKILLYAPTFRQINSFSAYSIDYMGLINLLEKKFNGFEWKILVRLHPNFKKFNNQFNIPNYIINTTEYPDIQELLCASDIVVTDYSALMFDFYLINRPIFLYCADFDEYTKNDRDLYISPSELPFSMAKNNDELFANIASFNQNQYIEDVEVFKNKIGCVECGNSCKNLISIMDKFIRK